MLSRLSISFVVFAGLATACTAQHYLHGATIVREGTPASGALGSWDVGICTETNGNTAGAPAITYHLMQGAAGPELFERSPDGSGALITNAWQDAQGWHFYTWVRNTGWEMVLTDPGQPGVRNVYTSAGTVDGRPTGPLAATCPLTPAANP